jgi:hypothetical protein
MHFVMESCKKSVQNPENEVEKQPRKRSQADKVGKLKYLLQKDQKLDKDIAEIKVMICTLLEGLESSLNYDQSRIEKLACEDEIDGEILQVLYEAGSLDLLPKDACV